ncbi:hypothetical protein ACHAQA_003774 [Verticillium albo-atrum]
MAEKQVKTNDGISRADQELGIGPNAAKQELNSNKDAVIVNHLSHLSKQELHERVEAFAALKELTDLAPLIQKGALIARDPQNYELLEELDENDKTAIRDETMHKWRQPKALYTTVIVCSVAAAVQGWDQTGTNGANLSFPLVFGIDGKTGMDPWIVGFVNAAPYLAASLLGCWLCDPFNFYLGRRLTIFISAIFCIFPVIGSAISQTWEQLLVTRILMGLGMGLKASTVPVFAAESAPPNIRGALVMSWQMYTALGICIGLGTNLAVYNTGDIAWRLQLGSAFIPAVPLAIGVFFCPESPRWFMKKNRYRDAFKSLCRLRNTPLQAARDLYSIHVQLETEAAAIGNSNYFTRFIELFTIPRTRRATLASFVVMLSQQLCGINIIAFYSSTIFYESGFTFFQALVASFGFGLVNFFFAFPALWTIDTFGRRNLLLFTFPQMTWCLLAAALASLLPKSTTAHLALVALFVFLFAAFYSAGEGPVPFAYSAEVFPLSHREVGMAWAVATCFFWSAVLSITFPTLLAQFGQAGAFGFYAGCNFVALVLIFFLVPETKQRTLEELDYVFAVPTRVHAGYQVREALPYFFRRWVRFDKSATLVPLYQTENIHSDGHSSIHEVAKGDLEGTSSNLECVGARTE